MSVAKNSPWSKKHYMEMNKQEVEAKRPGKNFYLQLGHI